MSTSPPAHHTRSKRKTVDQENVDPNTNSTVTDDDASNKHTTKTKPKPNTRNTKQKTPATANEMAKDTPRIQFTKYLDELDTKYPNHSVMILESLLPNENDDDAHDDEEEEDSDKEPAVTFSDLDALARVIIPTSAATAYEQFHQQWLDAIDCSDGFVVTWTKHSDIVMNLLEHRLTTFNTLSRQMQRQPATAIPAAFDVLFSTSLVMTEFQFWYCDTEEPERCDEIATEILKGAWNRLLKRSDQELGFIEPRTRTDIKRWLIKSYKEIHQTIQQIYPQ